MKTAMVTGAGSGIGRASAVALTKAGWRVAMVGRRVERLEDAAAGLDGAVVIAGDVSKPDEVERIFAEAVGAFGRLDLLFNNAGRGSRGKSIDEMELEDWFAVLDVNLTGSVLCARAAFAQMRAQDPQGGRIINNGSISAHAPRPGSTPYTVTKHAITGLTKCIALDGRHYSITCGQIDIGNAETEMAAAIGKGAPQAHGEVKAEPMMEVDDVARSVVHMADLPLDANVLFMTVMASNMPCVGRG